MPGKQTQQQKILQFSAAGERADLEAQLRELAKEIVFGLSDLEPAQSKDLLGSFVSELFLSAAEQGRRESRRQRQAEGIAAAKARGAQFGRPRKPLPDNFDECHRQWRDGKITMREAAEACEMPKSSFYAAAVGKEKAGGRAV